MDNLTSEQRTRLEALLAALATLPTPELIRESGRLRIPLPLDDTGGQRMYQALGGAIAAQKLIAYILALRAVNEQRGTIGREISRLLRKAEDLRAIESLDAAEPMVMAAYRSGEQEVMFHFFAVCAGRIERFLSLAAKAAGYKIPKADRDLLATFRPLRDYYEHMEDRLPGRTRQAEVVTEQETAEQWTVRMGLERDQQGRIVVGRHAVDVTPRGLQVVEDILQRTWDQLRVSALIEVHKHVEADPSDIPGPEDVDSTLLAKSSES